MVATASESRVKGLIKVSLGFFRRVVGGPNVVGGTNKVSGNAERKKKYRDQDSAVEKAWNDRYGNKYGKLVNKQGEKDRSQMGGIIARLQKEGFTHNRSDRSKIEEYEKQIRRTKELEDEIRAQTGQNSASQRKAVKVVQKSRAYGSRRIYRLQMYAAVRFMNQSGGQSNQPVASRTRRSHS